MLKEGRNSGIQVVEMQVGRDDGMSEGLRGTNETCEPRCTLSMTNDSFDGADGQLSSLGGGNRTGREKRS